MPSFVSGTSAPAKGESSLLRSRGISSAFEPAYSRSSSQGLGEPVRTPGGRLETVVSAFQGEEVAQEAPATPWWVQEDGSYLCIAVREARGIAVIDTAAKSTSA